MPARPIVHAPGGRLVAEQPTTPAPPAAPGHDRVAVAGALAGALTIVFSAILVALAEVEPAVAAVYRCLYALPALGLLAYLERRRHGPRTAAQRRLALAAGPLFAANLVLWHHAIEDVGAGLATVLGNLQVVVVAFGAWAILGERPERRTLAALPIALAGVVLISGVLEGGAYGREPARGVIFGLLTAVAYGGFILALRHGNRELNRPAGPLFDITLSASVSAALIGLAIGETDLVPRWPAHGWLLVLALTSQVFAWMLISASLPRLPAALGGLLLTLQPVGAVALGVVLLAEAPTALQLAGTACILAGLVTGAARPRGREPPPQLQARPLRVDQ
jgi:drug/metabolite transporter (DMT)-like permease